MPTAGAAAVALPLMIPSRLVTPLAPGVPVNISTPNTEDGAKLKYPGRVLTLKKEGVEPIPVGGAVKRDQRRVTVSTLLATAAVVPMAAVKALTWTATDWPNWRAAVVVAFAKFP